MNKLTDVAVKKSAPRIKAYKMSDGGGMYLEVMPNGSKYWRLKYRFGGKEKRLALGVYPDVGLADARTRRDYARKLLANDADPSEVKKQTKRAAQVAATNSFENIAREFHKARISTWTERHAKYWLLYMERFVFPVIGDRQVDKIEPMELLDIMRDIEKGKTYETRDRLAQSIGAVFKYAMGSGRAKHNPAAALSTVLTKRPTVAHYPCVSAVELPNFLRAVSAYETRGKVSPIAISAFRLLMLTATRTSEVRFAKWKDFDLDAGAWIVPAEQKGRKGKFGKRKDHAVPLCTQAVAILRSLYPVTGQGEYVFPNRNSTGRVISENTALKIIETIGFKGKMTGHGFRSLARSILGDMGYRWEVLEAMLSHAIANETAAAYVRTSYFEERRGIMQQWADYLDKVEAGAEVIPLKAA